MINELYQLSSAIKNAEINTESWHRKYLEIPNISNKAPCIRIVLGEKEVPYIESISPERKVNIRKFGSNQGSFPAMNMACLFRIYEEDQIKKLSQIRKNIEKGVDLSEVKELCIHNNWASDKYKNKYKICFENVPQELRKLLKQSEYAPVEHLIEAANQFINPLILHEALCKRAFAMIEEKQDAELALQLLFYSKSEKEEEFGNLSVLLDTFELEDQGLSTAGIRFTRGLNRALIISDEETKSVMTHTETDAFGDLFSPLDDPMPKVKLSAGFEASLRTMFRGQPCQFRYKKIENETYPISFENRNAIKGALEWISRSDLKNKTWVSTDKDEVLFIYPSRLPERLPGLIGVFAPTYEKGTKPAEFEAQASAFAEYITKTKESDPEEYPEYIQIFMLKKIDRARTKVIYSQLSSPQEIISKSDAWQKAANNLPQFYSGKGWIPFPIEIPDILNRVWRQDGGLSSDKFKPVKSYHGLELLFGLTKKELEFDLQTLLRNTQKLSIYAGRYFNNIQHPDDQNIKYQIKSSIVLLGMLLYWLDVRKDDYMNEFPYLLGQLLKVSDSLHELYCYKERDGNIPPQLVGGSMYVSAAEFPKQAISQLAQRMMPYLNWARTHQSERAEFKRINSDGTESTVSGFSAGYLLYQYTQIADKLIPVLSDTTRFNDMDKASLFIGYLASFPKSSKAESSVTDSDEGK